MKKSAHKEHKAQQKRKSVGLWRGLLQFFFIIPVVLFFIAGFSLISCQAHAATGLNRVINFQGRVVKKADGTNVTDGTYSFTFKIYDAASSGNLLWQETQSSVQVTSGIFQVALGSVTAFNAGGYNVDFKQNNLYLDITFNSETFGTRIQLAAVPQAIDAEQLDGVIATQSASAFTLTGGLSTPQTLTVNGNITVGSTIQPTAVGGLTVSSNGSNALTLTGAPVNINTTGTGNVSIGNGTGTVALTLGSDATGDLYYRGAGGTLTRLAVGTGSQCLIGGTTPTWGACSSGGGIGTIQEGGSNTVTSATTLNFTASDFNITNSGGGVGLVAIDYTNSHITQSNQAITVTGGWTFNTTQTTFGSLIHANSGIDTSTANQNLTLGANGLGNITATVNGGGNAGLILNDTGAGNIFTASASGTTVFSLAQIGAVTINNTSSTDIVKSTSGNNSIPTDYNYTANGTNATLTNLDNSNGIIALTNGTVPNSGNGTISTSSQPAVNAAIGAGALTISRSDGKYLLIRGGASTGTAVYDSYANTFTASTATTANVGAGALALPRPDGKYELILGGATATRNTIDPLMNTGPASEAGGNFCASATSGTAAYRRLNGKFLVACGGLATTTLFDPVAISWAAGPSATTGTFGAGSLVLPRPDGQALIIEGGASANTQLYDPYNGASAIGSFTAGPSLPTGCEINGAGSVAIQLPNYTYLILSKSGVNTVYDPQAGTFGACNASGPSTALADGAHAIPMQNGKYLIIVGSGSTKAIVYDPAAGTFTDHTTALSAGGAGEHSFMRPDGTWQILVGGGTTTNNFNTGLPMTGQYVSEDITSSSLNITSTANYDIGAENILTGQISQPSTTQFGVQVLVRTASSQGNLSSATDKAMQSSGSLIYPSSSDNWIRLTVNFARRIPQYIMDDRGTWTGNSSTVLERDYESPLLKELTIDNSTLLRNTSFDFTNPQPSSSTAPGPTLTRLQGMVDKLVLPPGVLTETTQVGTTGFYTGKPGPHNPLPTATGDGTIVLQRPDKSFGIIATGSASFILYDNNTATFSAQTGAGNIPTAITGAGAFALKLPGEKYLIVLGNNTTTTNIYDPYAASGSHFTTGPTLSAAAGMGATAILNADNTYTIVHGGNATTTSLFDPVGNQGAGTLPAGPTLTTAANCGFFAIPMAAPNSYQYFVAPGVAPGQLGSRVGINYDAKAKVFTQDSATFFTAAQAPGCGAYAFQRQDGYWLIVSAGGLTGAVSGATEIFNPWANTMTTGPAFTAATVGRGSVVIPRADGTFLITFGQNAAGTGTTTTNIYFPWGNTFGVGAGIGTMVAGPAMNDVVGAGALSFWRPDGKFVVINGAQVGSTTVDTYDAGWYADGQYLSGQNNVSQLSSNSTLTWSQTADKYVGVQVRTAASQAALNAASFHSVANSGGNLNITSGDTWIQVQINMSRDFPVYSSIPAGSDSFTVSEGGAYLYPTIAMPTLNWYKISNDADILTLQSGGSNVFRVSSSGSVYTSSTGGYYSGGADLAERYTSTQDLQPGEVVTNDPTSNASVMRSVGQYQQNLLGVVSTDPGFVAGSYTTDSYPIALAGRVPVLISTENGPIHAGDYLTSASIPGYAMKATVAGQVIGQAMEDFNPQNASVCPQESLGNLPSTQCGSVMMFVNLASWQGESVQVAMADQAANGTSLPSTAVDGVQQDGTQTVIASRVIPSSDSSILAFLENQQNSFGSSIYTGQIAASGEIITPKLVADMIYAKSIQADQIIGLDIYTNKISQLSDSLASLSAQLLTATQSATFDSFGNPFATPSAAVGSQSGQLSLNNLSVLGLATVSADFRVKGNGLIEGILNVIDTLSAHNMLISGVSDFFGVTNFHDHITVAKDSAGVAIIKQGTNEITITFVKSYDIAPVVTANISLIQPTNSLGSVTSLNDLQQQIFSSNYQYIITNVNSTGFTIILNKTAIDDVPFSWTAVGTAQ